MCCNRRSSYGFGCGGCGNCFFSSETNSNNNSCNSLVVDSCNGFRGGCGYSNCNCAFAQFAAFNRRACDGCNRRCCR